MGCYGFRRGSKTLTIVDSAPGGDVGESCVSVIDSQTGTASPATFEKTNGDGTSNWTYVATVSSGVAEGNVVRYTLRLRTCSDLTTLGPDTLAYLFVDNTAPTVTSWSPSLTNHPSPAISIQAYDPNYGFIDMSSSSITAGMSGRNYL